VGKFEHFQFCALPDWLFRLDFNALTGTIPSILGALPNLQFLQLRNNTLTGTIPSEFGAQTSLDYLKLDYNSLTGSIPAELLDKNFIDLTFYGNQISNLIPIEGQEICSAGGGEVYCNCELDCTFNAKQCGCEEALSCCSSFLEPYSQCDVCGGGELANPDFEILQYYQTTCAMMADYIYNNVIEFGSTCGTSRYFFNGIGCRCSGGETASLGSWQGTSEDNSGVFVESSGCPPQMEGCRDASICYDHTSGICSEDGISNPEYCGDALDCAPCFPNSRCSGYDSGMFVISEVCPPEMEGCMDASPCYSHNFGLCGEDGVLATDCAEASPICDPCFPKSRCGGIEALITADSIGT